MEDINDLDRKFFFYSESEQIAFFIAGYWRSISNVKEFIDWMNRAVTTLLSEVPEAKFEDVQTRALEQSRRYKHMRIFFVKAAVKPEKAFSISGDEGWTMMKWLTN